MKKFRNSIFLLLIVITLTFLPKEVSAQSTEIQTGFPEMNGRVETVKVQGDRIYLGGAFSYLGESTGRIGIASISDNELLDFPMVTGTSVNKSLPDGNGGFYIAGNFTTVGGEARSNIARILPDGTVDLEWAPSVNGEIYDIKLNSDKSILYIAGAFTKIDGFDQKYVAALYTAVANMPVCTPTVTYLNEGFEGETFPPSGWTTGSTAWSKGTTAYEGDSSAQSPQAGYLVRTNLDTSVTLTDPALLEFYWKVSSRSDYGHLYYCIDNASCNYLSGFVQKITGEVDWNKQIVHLDAGTHTLTWKYENRSSTTAGSNRGWVDKVSVLEYETYPCDTLLISEWNPSPNNVVNTIEITSDDSTIYLGGEFTLLAGETRSLIGAVNTSGEIISEFNIIISTINNAAVKVLKLNSDETKLYIGGFNITSIGGVDRINAGAVNTLDGSTDDWNPNLEIRSGYNQINSILVDNDAIWLGGRFLTGGGIASSHLLVVDSVVGNSISGWSSPFGKFQYPIFDISIFGGNIFVLSSTPIIQGSEKGRLLIYDETTKQQTNDDSITFNGEILTICFDENNNKYLLGGKFSSVGGDIRNGIAALDVTTKEVLEWNPKLNPGANISDIEIEDNKVYIGGLFSSINGYSRGNMAIVDACSGNPYDWNPNFDGRVNTIELNNDGSKVYVGGNIYFSNDTPISKVASFFTDTYQLTDWRPQFSDQVTDIKLSGNIAYMSGNFNYVNGEFRELIVGIDTDTGELSSFNPIIPSCSIKQSSTIAVTSDGNRVFVGGRCYYDYIIGYNVTDSSRITLPSMFSVDDVRTLKINSDDSLLFIGGRYTGGARALDLNTYQFTSWYYPVGYTVSVYDIDVKNEAIFVGGSFTEISGQPISFFTQFGTYNDTDTPLDCTNPQPPPTEEPPQEPIPYIPLGVDFNNINKPIPRSSLSKPNDFPNYRSISMADDIYGGDIIRYNGVTYIGGGFGQVVGRTSGMAPIIDKNTFEFIEEDFPILSVVDEGSFRGYYKNVYSIIPDGDGGWYVGGYFNRATELVVNHLIHVLPDYTVDISFLPIFGGQYWNGVVDLELSPDGNTLYVGGNFTTVNGQTRNRLCSFDLTTGELTSWNPNANDYVNSLELSSDGSLLFVGGKFTTIGVTTRNRLASFETSTGNLSTWNPSANNQVRDLELNSDETAIYVAGEFTSVGGAGSNAYLELIDMTGVHDEEFVVTITGSLRDVFVTEQHIFIGGSISSVNGIDRRGLAKLDLDGNLTDWGPMIDDYTCGIYGLHYDNEIVYFAGYYNYVDGHKKSRMAAVDATTGELIEDFILEADTSNGTTTIATDENHIYWGGYHSLIGYDIDKLFRIKEDGKVDTSFKFNINGTVNSLAAHNNILYIGGDFTVINGVHRDYIASIDLETNELTNWNPYVNGYVYDIKVAGDTIYIGGYFSRVNAHERQGIAAFNNGSNIPSSWNPMGSGNTAVPSGYNEIYTIYPHSDKIYIGGDFYYHDENTATNLLSIDAYSGLVDEWFPTPNDYVYSIVGDDNRIYVGGDFTFISDEFIDYLVGYDLNNNLNLIDFNLGLDDEVNTMGISQNSLFVVGDFFTPKISAFELNLKDIVCDPPTQIYYSESFEGETLPSTNWTIDTGDVSWIQDTVNSSEGGKSVNSSSSTGNNQVAILEYTFTLVEDATLSFDWKVSSESGYDFLYYCIDNPTCTSSGDYESIISGEVNWTTVVESISAGSHTITWKYEKDSSSADGDDMGWIDNFSLDNRDSTCTPIAADSLTNWNPGIQDGWQSAMWVADETIFLATDSYETHDNESFSYLAQYGTLPATGSSTPEIEFGYTNQVAYENHGSASIKLVLQTAPSDVDVSVNYTVTGGSATEDDFVLEDGTAIIPAGEFSTEIPVTLLDNEDEDGNKTIFLNLDSPTGSVLGMYHATTLTIIDDEGGSAPPPPAPIEATQLVVTPSVATINSGGYLTLTVSAQDNEGQIDNSYTNTIRFSSSDSSAVLPSDYTFTGGDAGQHLFTNEIQLNSAGTQTITITDLTNPGILANVVTITVNEVEDEINTSLSISPSTIENNGTDKSTVTVSLTDGSGNPIIGKIVTIEATGSGNTITQPSSTNESGQAIGYIASTVVGNKTVTVVIDGETQDAQAVLRVRDTTPAVIKNVNVSNISPSSVMISWQTNEPTTGQVEYGKTTSFGSVTDYDNELSKGHSIIIEGLESGTTYNFKIIARDEYLNESTYVSSFMTIYDPLDITTMVISNITTSSAIISWTTNVPSTGRIEYGPTRELGSTIEITNFSTTHSSIIGNLDINTKYYVKVTAIRNDETEESSISEFTTLATNDSTQINNIEVKDITDSTAIISFSTSKSVKVIIEYGTDTKYGQELVVTDFNRNHEYILDELSPDTEYHFRIKTEDRDGNIVTSADQMFKTIKSSYDPLEISNVEHERKNNRFNISWTTNREAVCTVEYGDCPEYGMIKEGIYPNRNLNYSTTLNISEFGNSNIHYKVSCIDSNNIEAQTRDYLDLIELPETGEFETGISLLEFITSTAVPILTSLALISQLLTFIANAGGLANLLSRFNLIFGVIFDKEKRKMGWGVIYDIDKKTPVTFAIVRLINSRDGQLAGETVTDLDGRYRFIVDDGVYKIEVEHTDFVMPTRNNNNRELNGKYLGGEISYSENRSVAYDIPMVSRANLDQNITWYTLKDRFTNIINKLGTFINIIGGILLILSVLLTPSITTISLFVINIIFIILIMSVKRAKWRDWGKVLLQTSSRGIPGVFVRVFDSEDKLINNQISDDKGRYGFILDEGNYVLTAESNEYESVKDISINIKGDSENVVKENIVVKRKRDSLANTTQPNSPFGI